jgi:hypothetical protein
MMSRRLVDLSMSHHDRQSCLRQFLNQRMSCVATEDFFNKIGHERTSFEYAETPPRNENCFIAANESAPNRAASGFLSRGRLARQ